MKYKVASLFAGVGGICSGFQRPKLTIKGKEVSYDLMWANEIDEKACITYKHNYNHPLIEGDIEKILDLDIISRERLLLVQRQHDLENTVDNYLNLFDLKETKKAAKKLEKNYLPNLIKGNNLELSPSIEKKLINGEIPNNFDNQDTLVDVFTSIVEALIVENLLKDFTLEKLAKLQNSYKEKQDKILSQELDIINGGFPCQAFSLAGERRGFDDHRGELFYSFINLINLLTKKGYKKPRVLMLENVKNLVSHDNGNTFRVITEELEKLGYKIVSKVFNTYKYTKLPQTRERIYILAFLNEEDLKAFGSLDDIEQVDISKENLIANIKDTIDYSTTLEDDYKYYYTKEKYPKYFIEEDLEEKINITEQITEKYEFYQVRRGMYVRKNMSGVCPTLTANMGTGGHNVPLVKVNDGVRKLTPAECFKLQGFRVGEDFELPTTVSDAHLYKQSGNAVSIDVVELITEKLLRALVEVDNRKVKN